MFGRTFLQGRKLGGAGLAQTWGIGLFAILLSACGGDHGAVDQSGSSEPQVGQVTEALGTPPESNCTGFNYRGHDYWFCSTLRSWSTARSKCEAQGYNLVRIEDAAENTFVKGKIGLDSWVGGNDITTEGTWVWTFGGSNFWIGTASGHSANGLFSKWSSGEPNNVGNQDCAKMTLDGNWNDDLCSLSLRYVCESGGDQCPLDANKVIPGVCGCGFSDVDSDADGTPDCLDQCPLDATKIRPGDCGCSNAPKASGTACSDGLCAANTTCNGAGVCGNPSTCTAPDTNCTFGVFQNTYYWFCAHDRTFTDARQRCQTIGMDATAIESAAEDNFIESKVSQLDHVFIGGQDNVTEGTFVWKSTGQQFWSGGPNGSPTAGAYTNWEQGEPSDGLTGKDCMAKDPGINGGQWEARSCTLVEGYICEAIDACPQDPLKTAPGACGCNHPDTDTDHDGTPDCKDHCPGDPLKVERGVCDCFVPETDDDNDGIPNCADDQPHDSGHSTTTSCNPPTGFLAAGTRCCDGVCPGIHQCDASGTCGAPLACAPAANCTLKGFNGSWYWFCTGATTWNAANTACNAVAGRALVKIDSAKEDAFVSANVSAGAWIGANDTTVEGAWRWATTTNVAGPQFWTGNASGSGVDFSFNRWAPGAPGGASAENCASIQHAGGTWEDQSCSQSLAYVCEQSLLTLRACPDAPSFGDLQPGLTGTLDPGDAPNCVAPNHSPINGKDAGAELQHCSDVCNAPGTTEAECNAACSGAAAPPAPGSTCTVTPSDVRYCEPDPANIQSPETPCGSDPNNPDAECAAGFFCLHQTVATDPTCQVCKSHDPITHECNKDCHRTEKNICAKPVPSCLHSGTVPCSQEELCTALQQDAGGLDPGSTLDPAPTDPEALFGPKPPARPASDPWPDDAETPCDQAHCPDRFDNRWCHYTLDPTETLGEKKQDGSDQNGKRKHGSAGKGKLIQFDFDPNLLVKIDTDPGPLGVVDTATLRAEASLAARAHVNVLGLSTDIEVVDVGTALEAGRCGVKTPDHTTTFQILGIDFLPAITGRLGGQNDLPFDSEGKTGFEPGENDCESAYKDFGVLVDRSKKALKDTRELIEQFKNLPAGKRFSNTFFQDLGLEAPRDFVPPPPGGEIPQATINRFINYYNAEIGHLREAAFQLAQKTLDGVPTTTIPLITLGNHEETQVLASAFFFIGPLPCTMNLEAVVSYGADINANFEFGPGTLVGSLIADYSPQNEQQTLAYAQLNGRPHAGAAVRLFVGAGFSIPGFEVEAGVEGEVSLGTVSAPTYAGVGLNLGASEDPRAIPAGLQALQAFPGNKLDTAIHPKEYHFFVRYTLGSSIAIRNILDGSLAAKVEVEFLFFSKSWRQVILRFNGFCHEDANGNAPSGCDIPLFTAGGNIADPNTGKAEWGTIRMPMPFVSINQLPLTPPPVGSDTVLPVSTDRVGVFFYDSLCTCLGAPPAEKKECFRNDDCCDDIDPNGAEICFRNPETNKKECSGCRGADQSCEQDSDCCSTVTGGSTPAGPFKCRVRGNVGHALCGCFENGDQCQFSTECCSNDCDGTGHCNPLH